MKTNIPYAADAMDRTGEEFEWTGSAESNREVFLLDTSPSSGEPEANADLFRRLLALVDDPMWADHVEISKATLRKVIAALSSAASAEDVLRRVLSVVQRYMPPDGISAGDAISEIIALVDPWPLSAQVQPSAVQAETGALHKFYGVTTDAELIDAQARHIEGLQAKLPAAPSFAPTRVREG